MAVSAGDEQRFEKVMVIGLDSAEPDLLFGPWLSDLPNIRAVVDAGVHGPLRSVIPPVTVPAWMCMMTGQDPGRLGFYGFRNRRSYGYHDLEIVSSRWVHEKALWDILGDAGMRSIVIGVPPTYPPRPIRGALVSCLLTPGPGSQYTYPPELKERIEGWVGEYEVDVPGFRHENPQRLLERIYSMTEKRFRVARRLLATEPWELFVMVEMGTDRIHHSFWKYMDPLHVLHEPGSPLATAIYDYYRFVDVQVGKLLDFADERTLVLIVSDHGATRMDGGICINEWLIERGYLVLEEYPETPAPLWELAVDWKRTKAWGEGGYYGPVFLNIKGREPRGLLEPDEAERFRDRLKEELEALGDEGGNPIGTRVIKPDEVYSSLRNIPADLFVFFGDLSWRSVGSVGHGKVHTRENDLGPDGANHGWNGVFAMARGADLRRRRRLNQRRRRGGLSLLDVAPTVLAAFGIPPPPAMQGKPVPVGNLAWDE